MGKAKPSNLSRRERQLMDIIYEKGGATVADVHQAMPDAPSYTAVRTMLGLLRDKGHLRHKQEGAAYVYLPTVPAGKARRSALRHVVNIFFKGSAERAVATLIDMDAKNLTPEQVDNLIAMMKKSREKGR